MFCVLTTRKYILHRFQETTQILRTMKVLKGEQGHYIAVKSYEKGITSKINDNLYCLNCLHSFRKKSKFEPHTKKYLKIRTFIVL